MKKLENDNNTRYDSINGLRMIACLGIVLMHIKENLGYEFGIGTLNYVIDTFTNFVYLFMVISSFGMCCGYYEKIKKNKISVETFYKKRIKRIMPFLLFLIIIDVVYEHSKGALIEGLTETTLMFNFLQKDIKIIGVAWYIGLNFVFYMIFPYFVFLFSNKKRAWLTTIVSIMMNIISINYFKVTRNNMFYSFIYFCLGGMIYLYKERIIQLLKNKRLVGIELVLISILVYYITNGNEYVFLFKELFILMALMMYAISFESKVLNNKITKYISNVSMEVYLCHMVMFRIVEKIHIGRYISNDYICYTITFILVFTLSILFARVFQIAYAKISEKYKTLKKYKRTNVK